MANSRFTAFNSVITSAFYQTYTAFKQKLPGRNSSLWFLYLSFAPPVLLWLVSQIQPIYIERALLPSHAMFCIWLAWAFTQAKMPNPVKLFGLALILTSVGMGLYQHINYTGFPYGPYANLNERINEFRAGDVIIHSSKLSYLPSFYFDRDLAGGFIIDPPGLNVDTLSPSTRVVLHLKDYETIDIASANAGRIWFIIYQQSIDEFASQENSIHPHLQYLDDHFTLEKAENWQDIRLYLYTGEDPMKEKTSHNDVLWFSIVAALILIFGSIPYWTAKLAQTSDLRFLGADFDETDYAANISMMHAGKWENGHIKCASRARNSSSFSAHVLYPSGSCQQMAATQCGNDLPYCTLVFWLRCAIFNLPTLSKSFLRKKTSTYGIPADVTGLGAWLAPIDAWRSS